MNLLIIKAETKATNWANFNSFNVAMQIMANTLKILFNVSTYAHKHSHIHIHTYISMHIKYSFEISKFTLKMFNEF